MYYLTMLSAAFILVAAVPHPGNWWLGWAMVLAAIFTGALIGMGFHRDDFLGGYTSFRRRLWRLGHIALAALGMMNVLFALGPWPSPGSGLARAASICFIAGGVLMPTVCLLAGWRESFRHLFFLPVVSLILAVVLTLIGALP
ncbi:MAG: hypothetical protein ABIP55_06010 [Tepidisphaeraceae bacterium]